MKKKQRPRKHRAIRSLLLLAGLVLVLHFGNVYNFTPAAAMRDWERRCAMERMEEVAALRLERGEDVLTVERVALSMEGSGMMQTRQEFHPLMGWSVKGAIWTDRAPEQTVQILPRQTGDEKKTQAWISGWVNDPEITSLELRLVLNCWYGQGDEELEYLTMTVTDFIDWQGTRVFLASVEGIPPTYRIYQIYRVTEDGEEFLSYC